MIQLADRMEYVHSDIRGELYREALAMQARGIEVLKLNTGNPAAFGFPLPESIRAAIEGREQEAVPYCDFQGMPEAREAIAAYHRGKGIDGVEAQDVFIGNGVSEVVNFALMPLLNPGDEVLIPTPNYSLRSNTILLAGAKPVFYRCDEARKGQTSGHGLGLSIARIIVSAHKGKLKVRSKVGVGTTFSVLLP